MKASTDDRLNDLKRMSSNPNRNCETKASFGHTPPAQHITTQSRNYCIEGTHEFHAWILAPCIQWIRFWDLAAVLEQGDAVAGDATGDPGHSKTTRIFLRSKLRTAPTLPIWLHTVLNSRHWPANAPRD